MAPRLHHEVELLPAGEDGMPYPADEAIPGRHRGELRPQGAPPGPSQMRSDSFAVSLGLEESLDIPTHASPHASHPRPVLK